MDDTTPEAFIRQQIDAQPGEIVPFVWQGGEPTLCRLEFFQRVAELQKKYANGKRIENAFQTNDILLNEDWCHFFHDNGWLVGVSIDGPADLHDAYRVNRSGKPSHPKVLNAIAMLAKHRVKYNLLCVVNNLNSQQPQRLYCYLRALGTPFLQFIPLVEQDAHGRLSAESVSGEAWGNFLTAVFDIWVREDIGRVYVQLFDSTLGVWSRYPSQMCSFGETCGHAFLHQIPIKTLNASHEAAAFGESKKASLSEACQRCDVLRFCRGDCPKHRIIEGKSALCHGYYHFFSHSAPHMRVMRDLLHQRRSPVELMDWLRRSG
jgi:Arylsulfatase regulator (Fe-S oxidoreductase)